MAEEAARQRQIERWKNIKQPVLSTLECIICKCVNSIDKYTVLKSHDDYGYAGELTRYKCPNCDVIFGDLRFLNMSDEEIGADYTDIYTYYKEGDNAQIFHETIEQVDEFKDKSKRILDFACGAWSNLIVRLRNAGYNVSGFDKYVSRPDINLTSINNEKFDIIYTTNYIEHLIHPYEQFKELVDHLSDDGCLIMMGPCFEYHIPNTHYHTIFFINDKSLQYICNALNIYISNSYNLYAPCWPQEKITVKVFKKMPTV